MVAMNEVYTVYDGTEVCLILHFGILFGCCIYHLDEYLLDSYSKQYFLLYIGKKNWCWVGKEMKNIQDKV